MLNLHMSFQLGLGLGLVKMHVAVYAFRLSNFRIIGTQPSLELTKEYSWLYTAAGQRVAYGHVVFVSNHLTRVDEISGFARI